jgi:flagellar protein FliS
MDVGGRPAQALSEFYTSIFAQILQASQSASRARFDHTIDCIKNVREAWRQVAKDPVINPAPLQVAASAPLERRSEFSPQDYGAESSVGQRWNA